MYIAAVNMNVLVEEVLQDLRLGGTKLPEIQIELPGERADSNIETSLGKSDIQCHQVFIQESQSDRRNWQPDRKTKSLFILSVTMV